jgi:hypothetical protein
MIVAGRYVHGMKGARRSFRRQKKHFVRAGLPGVGLMHNGTINVNTLPAEYYIQSYDYLYKDIKHKSFPRKRIEDFGFIHILRLEYNGIVYDDWGYMYFPHKSPHYEKLHIFELVGPYLQGLRENDIIEITVGSDRLRRTG